MFIVLLIIGFILIGIVSSIAKDELIKYQYIHYPNEWKLDGSPRGMFFNPKSSSSFVYNFPLDVIIEKFVYKGERPDWISHNDEQALKLWRKSIYMEKLSKYYLMVFFPLLILIQCTEI